MKARRALALFLFAAGCFGLGLAVARWAGWGPASTGVAPPPGASGSAAAANEPRIYIDAGVIELHDASLTIDPPPPPRVPPE